MRDVLRLSLPFTLWLAAFCAVYGLHGLICSSRWAGVLPPGTGRTLLVAAALVAVGLQGAVLWSLRPEHAAESRFAQRVSLTLAVAALVASVWTLIPVAVTSHCL